jgi:hypothetical protein
MNAIRRKLALAGALALALLLGGCGGDKVNCTQNPAGTGCPPPPPPSPTPVTTLITGGSFSGLGARNLSSVPFNTSATGTIDATVDWTFTTDNVEIYIVRGTCTVDQFNNRTCPFIAFSESPSAKPEKVTASNQAPGSFNLYIGNRGPAEEAVSYQVFLTTGGSGSSASTTRVSRVGRAEDFVGMLSGP